MISAPASKTNLIIVIGAQSVSDSVLGYASEQKRQEILASWGLHSSGRSWIYKSEFRGQVWVGNINLGASLQVIFKTTGLDE